jgi:alkylation response protein AidB-like acyl-CoA dehydrogenase
MSFSLTPEQEELRASVRRFLGEKSPSSEVRRLMESETGKNAHVWSQLTSQLGLTALIIPEEHGGLGYGTVELAVVLEEMGAALLVSPYFATVALAAQTLLASGSAAAQARWLPGLADGSATATVAVSDDGGPWELAAVGSTAEATGDRWRITGTKNLVIDGDTADLVVVAAWADSELELFVVHGDAAGLGRTRLEALDPTRRLARLELDGVEGVRVGLRDASDLLERAADLVAVALAAEQVGGAQRCLDMAVDYAKVRVQFGRPIGSFQAIKHTCADVLLQVESARSAATYAAAVAADGGPEASVAASLAQSYCSEAFTHAAKASIQVHGGIGFTWEHDAHLYLKRAKSSELLFGTPVQHRARLAALVGI